MGDYVLFRSPKDDGIFAKVLLPPRFDMTQSRRVNTLAKQVYEIANRTGPATFRDYPLDDAGLVALMVAQKCCIDEKEFANISAMGRAICYIMTGVDRMRKKDDLCLEFIKEKKECI